jgi:HEAT repeat protein
MTKKRKRATTSSRKRVRKSAPAASPRRRIIDVPLRAADLQPALDTLRDPDQPIEDRFEALQSIQAASFAIIDFNAVRAEYVGALRQAAQDENYELRQRALGILAREHDGFAQDVLLEGLRNPDNALVEAPKALQLLSYDPHAALYPIARDIVKTTGDESTRREAVRILAGDPASAPLLETVLADKSEPPEIRRMSASALHALNPDRLQRWAHSAVLDSSEDEEMVATGLTALTQFGDAAAIADNKPLRRRIGQLQQKAPARMKRMAKQFARKWEI